MYLWHILIVALVLTVPLWVLEKNRRSKLNGLFDNFNQIINIYTQKMNNLYVLTPLHSYTCIIIYHIEQLVRIPYTADALNNIND